MKNSILAFAIALFLAITPQLALSEKAKPAEGSESGTAGSGSAAGSATGSAAAGSAAGSAAHQRPLTVRRLGSS